MARASLSHNERELAELISLERLLKNFLQRYRRPKQSHEPMQLALEHVISERTLLSAALSGEPSAMRARRIKNDGGPNAVGE